MARKPERYPALYERLSHDDELQGESNSISNQKRILEDYAEQHGFTNCIHFTDDGISGTQFDRPGFQKMIAEVKADRISVVIIKDMSRFGRDYLQVGTYMEVLRKHDTRLIALNDSVDTLKGDDEFTPFRNIMNEWYARDTSKKIRSAFQAKNLAGKHTSSSVPYGYLKSEQDKNQWVIDPVAAPIVQRIYRMTMEGKGPYQIAAILSAEHIEIPAYYHQKLGIGLWQTREIRDPYKWGSSTIVHILTNPCYLGHTCNFKTRKHFKDKKSHYVDQDQWTIMPPSCNCSCFAFTTEQEILLGRNSDFLTEIERLNQNVVYKLTDGVYSFTGNTTAFVEIEDGVNEHGLAVGLTSVYPNHCKPGFNAGMIVRYLLEKCKNVSEAVSCLYQLPIASAQTLTLADAMGTITVIECNAEQIKVEKTLNNNLSFVCATNTFHFPEMMGYNNDKIDNWFAEERYQTLYSAFNRENGGFNLPFAEKLLSGDYGFLCQYDRNTGKDTVWSVIYDMKRHKIYRSEGNPGRHKFKEDTRFQF